MQGLLSCKTRTDTLLTAQTDTLCPHQRTLSVRTNHAGLPHPTSFHSNGSNLRALSRVFVSPSRLTDGLRTSSTDLYKHWHMDTYVPQMHADCPYSQTQSFLQMKTDCHYRWTLSLQMDRYWLNFVRPSRKRTDFAHPLRTGTDWHCTSFTDMYRLWCTDLSSCIQTDRALHPIADSHTTEPCTFCRLTYGLSEPCTDYILFNT